MSQLIFKIINAVLMLAALSGCATSIPTQSRTFKSEFTEVSKFEAGDAIITVSRPLNSSWGQLSICIHDVNNPIGILGGSGGELKWKHSSGYVAIVANNALAPEGDTIYKNKENPIGVVIFKVEAGKTYSFSVDILKSGKLSIKPDNPTETSILYEMTSDTRSPEVSPISNEWRTKLAELKSIETKKIDPNAATEDISTDVASTMKRYPDNYRQLVQDYIKNMTDSPYAYSYRQYEKKTVLSISNPVPGHVANRWGWIINVEVSHYLDSPGIRSNWVVYHRCLISEGKVYSYNEG